VTTFADLGVRPRTLETLTRRGIAAPLAVQEQAIPHLLARRDVVIAAPTGSGKTLAFLVPLVERLSGHRPGGARALIVVPTRELANQIVSVLASVDRALRVAVLYGGVGYGPQNTALRNSPDVVVGCPGRILDLADRGVARFDRVEYLVLDEADEMLDQGFAKDVERIIAMTPQAPGARQTVLASATMPDWVQRMIERHLDDPAQIRVRSDEEPLLEQGVVRVRREARVTTLSAVLRRHGGSAIVFHRTKHGAKKLARDLARLGHATGELQGNLSQNARDRAIGDFRRRRTDVLVATNVAARGLDIAHVELVINYELPESPQWLTHRVGRTARNGAAGRALTFLSEDDMEQWRKLRRLGAPALRVIDDAHLLATGELRYLEVAPPGDPAARQVPARSGERSAGATIRGGHRSGPSAWRRHDHPAGPVSRPRPQRHRRGRPQAPAA
jgi:ATP-dependent RNA helicase RhlE